MRCSSSGNSQGLEFPQQEKVAEIIATCDTILVVGGGISGMTAALEAAECG